MSRDQAIQACVANPNWRDTLEERPVHNEAEGTIYIDSDTQNDLISEWEEPKKPKLLAPAIVKTCGEFSVSLKIYSSEKEAMEHLNTMFVSWPAVPNEGGFYKVMK
jgi:hypothetical protein